MNTIKINDYVMYHLPVDTIIYRGNTNQYLKKSLLNHSHEFFALDERVAGIYGLVVMYKVTKELFLYAMDNLKNLEKLYLSAPKTIQSKIKSAFGYSTQTPIIFRQSDDLKDKEILNYLCSIGFEGYGCLETETDETIRKFHAEIAVCNPGVVLTRNDQKNYTPEQILEAQSKSNLQKFSSEIVQKRKKNYKIYREEDEEDEEEYSKDIKKKLF